MEDHDRIDLAALSAAADAGAREHAIGELLRRARPELERRAAADSPVPLLSGWLRPGAILAGLGAAAALAALWLAPAPRHPGDDGLGPALLPVPALRLLADPATGWPAPPPAVGLDAMGGRE